MAMTEFRSMFKMNTVQQHVEVAQISSGLYCRTQISG